MLSCAGFRNDAFLAHASCKQTLAKTVIDLVRAGVIQILPLQINLRAAPRLGESRRKIQRCRTAGVVVEQIVELGLKA